MTATDVKESGPRGAGMQRRTVLFVPAPDLGRKIWRKEKVRRM